MVDITHGLWSGCHGGQRQAAEFFLQRGGDVNRVGYDQLAPLDAARRTGADDLVTWLRDHDAKSTSELS